MSELKPCPFCGAKEEDLCPQYHQGQRREYVICGKCDAYGPAVMVGTDPVEMWNTRVSPWRSLRDDPPDVDPDSMLILRRTGDNPAWTIVGPICADIIMRNLVEDGFNEWCEVPE